MARIILASGSPRRQELLRRIGLREFEISVPDVEEWYPPELAPEDIVAYISREKSQAVQAAPLSSPPTPWSFWMISGWGSPMTRRRPSPC